MPEIDTTKYPFNILNGVVWAEPDIDIKFIEYVEAILNCGCCKNNFADEDHHHNSACYETIEIEDQEV